MATSGEAFGAFSGRNAFVLRVAAAVAQYDNANNRSRWAWSVQVRSPGGTGTWAGGSFPADVWIANQNVWNGGTPGNLFDFRDGAAYHEFGGTTDWVQHNAQGYATIPIGATISNASLFGTASASTSFAADRIPKPPSGVNTPKLAGTTTATQFGMSWFDPTDWGSTDGKGSRFDVQRALNSAFTSGLLTLNNGASKSVVFTGLTPATRYWGRVSARNSDGLSDFSNPLFVDTLPGTPTNLRVTEVGGTDMKLAWTRPAGGDRLTNYIIQRSTKADLSENLVSTEVGSDVTTLSVTGLKPGVTYYFRIVAENDTGRGLWSSVISKMTFAGAKVWTGSAMRAAVVKVWTGAQWKVAQVKVCSDAGDPEANPPVEPTWTLAK
uniref:Minor tail protein n=1 Tax=Micrococcus phage Kurnik TaxID=3092208 RepID=A0AAU6R697_9CAUD